MGQLRAPLACKYAIPPMCRRSACETSAPSKGERLARSTTLSRLLTLRDSGSPASRRSRSPPISRSEDAAEPLERAVTTTDVRFTVLLGVASGGAQA
eukprot:scaffold280676_cov27-Tisochrysis_lutea.AAC.6